MTLFVKFLKSMWETSRPLNIYYVTSKNSTRLFSAEVDAAPKKTIRMMMKKKKKREKVVTPAWVMLTIPVAAFGLGTWQIQRKIQKDQMIKELKLRTSQEPVELPQDLSKLESMEYYPIKVKGTFDHSKEIYMGPRPMIVDGQGHQSSSSLLSSTVAGFLVITPFTLSDRNLTILVNRGWVPVNLKNPSNRASGQVTGEVELVGLLRKTENRQPLGIKNHPEKGIWIYRDLNKMAEVTGAAPVMIDASLSSSVPDGPIGGQTIVGLPDNHLSYILTWYSLSAITGYMWYAKYVRPPV